MFTREQLLSIIPEPQKKRFVPVEQKKEKVIRNALQNYAAGCREEDVVAVYDTTISGNGKKGYLLAADGLYGYDFTTFKRYTDGVKKVPFEGLKSHYCFTESSIEEERKHHLSDSLHRFVYADGSSLVIYLSTVYGVEVIPVIEGIMECEDLLPDREQDMDEQCHREQDQDEAAEEIAADEEIAENIKTDDIRASGQSAMASMEQGRNFFFAGDYHKAAPLLSFASEEGECECEACFLLGRMYAEGLGVKKNAQKAKELFDKIQASSTDKICIIPFGIYPKGEGGEKELMRWMVLDRRDDELLLLSLMVIDAKRYHNNMAKITWEKCDLRKWLNKEFLKQAFSGYEQDVLIQEQELENPDNEDYRTRGGHSTKDKVFLLSIKEAQKYFNTGTPKRQELGEATGLGVTDGVYIYKTNTRGVLGFHTEYAREQGVNTDFTSSPFAPGFAWWWLRSPGADGKKAAYIDVFGGFIRVLGENVTEAEGGVRPALWLKLKP